MTRPTSHYTDCTPYITRDDSTIRELLHPQHHPVRNQSLAEARVPVGGETLLHRHHVTEELYYFLAGSGEMRLGDERFTVQAGDAVAIPPGTAHSLLNTCEEELVLLCCCAPAYRHEDTELL